MNDKIIPFELRKNDASLVQCSDCDKIIYISAAELYDNYLLKKRNERLCEIYLKSDKIMYICRNCCYRNYSNNIDIFIEKNNFNEEEKRYIIEVNTRQINSDNYDKKMIIE